MAATENGVVIGLFDDHRAVVKAIDVLLKAGFTDEQLGFAARSDDEHVQQIVQKSPIARGIVGGILGAADMLLVPITGPSEATTILEAALPVTEEAIDGLAYPDSSPESRHEQPAESVAVSPQPREDAQERASIVTGGVIGGIFGAAAALLIPGIGPAVAGGILAAALGGGAIGGVAGGFLGAFTHLGVPHEKARQYEQAVKSGQILLSVKAPGRESEIAALLQRYGAQHVETH